MAYISRPSRPQCVTPEPKGAPHPSLQGSDGRTRCQPTKTVDGLGDWHCRHREIATSRIFLPWHCWSCEFKDRWGWRTDGWKVASKLANYWRRFFDIEESDMAKRRYVHFVISHQLTMTHVMMSPGLANINWEAARQCGHGLSAGWNPQHFSGGKYALTMVILSVILYIVVMGENNATIQWLNSRYYDCLVGGSNELSQGYPYFKDLDMGSSVLLTLNWAAWAPDLYKLFHGVCCWLGSWGKTLTC